MKITVENILFMYVAKSDNNLKKINKSFILFDLFFFPNIIMQVLISYNIKSYNLLLFSNASLTNPSSSEKENNFII